MLAGVQESLADGITVAGRKASGRDHLPRQSIQREPGLGSHGAAHQQRQSRHHDRLLDLGDTVIRSPISASSPAFPASPPDDPWEDFSSAARATRRRASSGPITSSGASAWSAIPVRRHVAVAADQQEVGLMLTNDQDGIAATDKEHGIAGDIQAKGFDVHRSRPLSAAQSTTSPSQIAATEEDQLRDRLRHFQSAAIRDLLDAVRATRLPSRRSRRRPRRCCSPPPSRRSATAAPACRPKSGGRTTIRSSRA